MRITLDKEPDFENMVFWIIRNIEGPLSISDFEYEYMDRYQLPFLPLIHCEKFQNILGNKQSSNVRTNICTKNYKKIKKHNNKYLLWDGNN